MSYDLYFYKHKDSQQTEEQLAEYLNTTLPFNVSEHPSQWHYEHPETGTYFFINWYELESEPSTIQTFDSFPDHKYLNLSFSINFFRPEFFGHEAFPIIEEFINNLDLFVLNPQDETDPDNPRKFPSGYLREHWIRHNHSNVLSHFDQLRFNYFPLDKSNYLWWFQLNRDRLQESLEEEDVFVPGYFVLKSKEDGELYTACIWPQCIPLILPPVDYLIIHKEYKKLFRTVKESGLVPYSVILSEFGELFEEFDCEVPNLKILREANAEKMKKDFNLLKLGMSASEFGNAVAFDSFVNSRP